MVSEQNKSDQMEDFDLEMNRFPLAEAFISTSSNDIHKTAALMQGANRAFVLSKTWNAKLNSEPIHVEPKVIHQETIDILPNIDLNEKQVNDHAIETELEHIDKESEAIGTSQTIEPIQLKEPLDQKTKIKKSKEKESESKSKRLVTDKKKLKGRVIRSIEPLKDKLAQDSLEPKLNKLKKEPKKQTNAGVNLISEKVKELKPNDFYSWLDSLNQASPSKKSKSLPKSSNKVKSDRSDSFPSKAKKSQELKAEVASETLAALLASQGHKAKAIKMYEKLIRKNPEKTIIFAALIEKLKS